MARRASLDHIAVLPVRGITNSLNVAMTASIVLYELLARWKQDRHLGCPFDA